MASSSLPHQTHKPNVSPAASTFLPTVCLYDWWLINAEEEVQGKRLGVAGFTLPKKDCAKQVVRIFKSAPIGKVYDFSTLETADGVCVILNGFMNKSLTAENGFCREVSQHFVFGFPLNWEKIVAEQHYSSAAQSTSPDMNSHVADLSCPRKKDQKSATEPNKLKSDGQPCATANWNYYTENAKDYPRSGFPKGGLDETREEPSSATPLAKPLNSSFEIGNLKEGSPRGKTVDASVIPHLQDPSSTVLGDDTNSHVLDQSSPCIKDQNRASERNETQSDGQHCSTENTKDYPRSALSKVASDKSREQPFCAPPLAKLRSSSCQITGTLKDGSSQVVTIPMGQNPYLQDQSTPGKKDHTIPGDLSLSKRKNQPRAKTKRICLTRTTEDFPGSGHSDNWNETRKDSSSAPPLAHTRKSHQIGSLEEGNAKGEKTPADIVPHFEGMVKTADSFKRSRSGRILMPRLAFWQNELPIYDVNRNCAGVQSLKQANSRDSRDVSRRRK